MRRPTERRPAIDLADTEGPIADRAAGRIDYRRTGAPCCRGRRGRTGLAARSDRPRSVIWGDRPGTAETAGTILGSTLVPGPIVLASAASALGRAA